MATRVSLPELLQTVVEENVQFGEGRSTGSAWYDLGSRLPMLGRVAKLASIHRPPNAQVSLMTGLEIKNFQGKPVISPFAGIAHNTITGEATIWDPNVATQYAKEFRDTSFAMQQFEYPPFLPEHEIAAGGLRQVLEGIQDGSFPRLPGRPTH